jgi:hypothetical protein
LLPIAIQTAHAFEKHEHLVSSNQVSFNLHENETDCSVFHFKINNNSIDFSSRFFVSEESILNTKIYSIEGLNYFSKLLLKSSRGPPYIML